MFLHVFKNGSQDYKMVCGHPQDVQVTSTDGIHYNVITKSIKWLKFDHQTQSNNNQIFLQHFYIIGLVCIQFLKLDGIINWMQMNLSCLPSIEVNQILSRFWDSIDIWLCLTNELKSFDCVQLTLARFIFMAFSLFVGCCGVVVKNLDTHVGGPWFKSYQCHSDSLGNWMYLCPGQSMPYMGNWVTSLRLLTRW